MGPAVCAVPPARGHGCARSAEAVSGAAVVFRWSVHAGNSPLRQPAGSPPAHNVEGDVPLENMPAFIETVHEQLDA